MSGRSDACHFLSATEALRRIRGGELTAVEFLEACLAWIDRIEPRLKAWAYLSPDTARTAARAIDRAIQQGNDPGPLAGIPIGVKDIFNTYDMPTAMGSPLWAGFTPGNDARVVSQLRLAGSVIPGKTATAELAVNFPGPTVNPHNPKHSPGTSSSGSAVAVAAYMVPLALGSQTSGSTIRPASYCGVYGFKPSFGLVPRTGCLKTADTLDTVAFFARTVDDLELTFNVARVDGSNYPISHARLTDPSRAKPADRAWRVVLVRGPKWSEAETYARDALVTYASRLAACRGVIVDEAELAPEFDQAHEVHESIYDKALSYYFKEEFERGGALLSPLLKSMILRGQTIPLDRYRALLRRQADMAIALDRWFEGRYDVVLTLSTGGEAMKGLETRDRPDNCLIWALCGVPAMNVPAFVGPTGLPVGAQLVARRYGDFDLLRFARFLSSNALAPDATLPHPVLCEQYSEGVNV